MAQSSKKTTQSSENAVNHPRIRAMRWITACGMVMRNNAGKVVPEPPQNEGDPAAQEGAGRQDGEGTLCRRLTPPGAPRNGKQSPTC